MPTRYLFEKLCVSQTLADLTADEERFFYRLLVKCDDFGRYYAQPALLRAACFPLLLEQVSDAMVEAWRNRLAEVGLIRVYQADGLDYLFMVTFGRYQRRRASASKFPPPSAIRRDPPQAAGIAGVAEGAGEALPEREGQCADGCPQAADVRGPMSSYSGIRNSISGIRRSVVEAREPHAAAAHGALAPTPAATNEQRRDQILSVPAPLMSFDAVLIGTPGYEPSQALFEQITERYGSLDLREEALKIASWLADPAENRRQRSATTKFILGWLKRELDGRAPPSSQNGEGNGGDATEIRRVEGMQA